MIIVRLFLFIALAAVAGAGLLYLFKRDRRYLRFIGQVLKYSVFLLTGVMLFYVLERLILFM